MSQPIKTFKLTGLHHSKTNARVRASVVKFFTEMRNKFKESSETHATNGRSGQEMKIEHPNLTLKSKIKRPTLALNSMSAATRF